MEASEQSSASSQPSPLTITVCPQYTLLTPHDTKSWPRTLKALIAISQDFKPERIITFMQQTYKPRGYENLRLIKKIKTDYFWSGAMVYLLNCIIKDSHMISGSFNVLWQGYNSVVKVTKYQIFLLIGHMFLGTMPSQLYREDTCFGRFMTVYSDQDEVTSQEVLEFRLNKLKSIAKYFCIFKKRSQQIPEMKQQRIIFQRHSLPQYLSSPEKLLNLPTKLCKIKAYLGQYTNERTSENKTSIYNMKTTRYFDFGKRPTLGNPNNSAKQHKNKSSKQLSKEKGKGKGSESPIPGSFVYNDTELDLEEKIWWSYPELFVLHLILPQGIGNRDGIAVHGIQRYADLSALSKHTVYDFKVRFVDKSEMHSSIKMSKNSIIFVPRQPYNSDKQYPLLQQCVQLLPSLLSLQKTLPMSQIISSGFYPQSCRQSKKRVLGWDIKLLIDWIAVSVSNRKQLEYHVEHQLYVEDLKVLVEEIKQYRICDLVNVMDQYWEFRRKDKAKIGLIEFFKDFVL